MDTVLADVRKILGGEMVPNNFDPQIIIHINTVLAISDQLSDMLAKKVVDKDTVWEDIIPNIEENEAIKSYVGLKVKKMFDPPTSSVLMTSLDENIRELEWRIGVDSK